jgi:hypothetical protein
MNMNIKSIDPSHNAVVDKKSKKNERSDNCQELKNIAYKTMLLNGNDISPKHDDMPDTNNLKISNYLTNESKANKKETWSKLDKTQKIIHLNNYADFLTEQDKLTEEQNLNLKKYLTRSLDRKCLIKTKEVIYDKENNKIINIPFLFFVEEKQAYILKKDDKHVSTIKSLPTEKKGKPKTINIHD